MRKNRVRTGLKGGLLTLLAVAFTALQGSAQAVTTSAISGQVTGTQGQPLASVQVVVINQATGTQNGVLTREDGRFLLPGLRPGSYRIEARSVGYRTETLENFPLALGVTERVDFVLAQEAVQLAGIEVRGERSGAVISRGRTGTAAVIDQAAVNNSPTISRNFTDFLRLSPQVTSSTPGTSAAGRNNRYNNIQIDGAVNNDLFGLAASGTPGGQADARPITLEAIQEFQVNIAPFDVRQGGFTGANINAVTRGGTNDFSGSLAYFGRNDSFVGKFEDFAGNPSTGIGEFEQSDLAFSLGGPIVRDRAHFFVAGELSRRTSPYGGILGVNTGPTAAEVAQISQYVQNQFGYDVGRSDQFPLGTDSNNIFARLDFQLNEDHRLTLRHNWVDAIRDQSTGGAGQTYGFSTSGYGFSSITNSTVAQLNSNLGGGVFNEARIGFTTVRDQREIGTPFPRIQVNTASGNVRIGPDEFSGQNALDQDIIEVTNDLTIARGRHNITLGTSNEFFQFSNLFVRNVFGNWQFNSFGDLQAGNANRYEYSFLLPGGDVRAEFPVRRWSVYAQDRWEMTDNFTLTFGVRADLTQLPDSPKENPLVLSALGRSTAEMPDNALQINPRVGFNWDVYGDRLTQVRGGTGLFSGRTPFVWISNAYGNSGLDYVRFTCTGTEVPLFTQQAVTTPPSACAGGGAAFAPNEVNTVDPDYRFPQVWRSSLAVDQDLGGGIIGTLEGLYSRTMKDIRYRNLLVARDPSGQMVEGRPRFRVNRITAGTGEIPVGDVIDIGNTDQGYSWSVTGQLQRPVTDGWGFNTAYTYSDSWDVNRGGSSQAISNWRFNPTAGDPNDLPAARSNFLIRHRILATGTLQLNLIERFPTLVSLVYVGESGQRYTHVYTGDVNGDAQNSNDLIYVPASANEIRFFDNSNGTVGNQPALSPAQSWENLNALIESEACLREARGTIIDRGACEEPWFNQIDLRIAQEVRTFGTQRLEVTLDVLNVGNLLNRSWGRKEFVANESFNLLNVRSTTPDANGRVLMNPFAARDGVTSIASLQSRYQFQLGGRYSF